MTKSTKYNTTCVTPTSIILLLCFEEAREDIDSLLTLVETKERDNNENSNQYFRGHLCSSQLILFSWINDAKITDVC